MKGLLNVLPGEGKDEPAGTESSPEGTGGVPPPAAGPEPANSGATAIAPTATAAVTPAVAAVAASTAPAPVATPAIPAKTEGKAADEITPEGGKVPITGHGVAVLTLSEVGEILSAKGCSAVFGCEGAALVGQNIRVLLKGGLDNDVGRFLHRQHAGKSSSGSSLIRVIALRKDGTEFPASITTVVLSADAALKVKSEVSRFWWTAFIRDMASVSEPGMQSRPSPQEGGPFAADFFRLQESHTALEKANEELQKQLQELTDTGRTAEGVAIGGVEIEGARAATAKAEAAYQQQVERANRLEKELAAWRGGEDVPRGRESNSRVAVLEDQLRNALDELEAVKATILDNSQSPLFTEPELRAQLETARQSAHEAETALQDEIARNQKLEERLQNLVSSLKVEQAERSQRFEAELRALRQERDELEQKLAAEQDAAAHSGERSAELEQRLLQNAAEVERARQELALQAEERARCESVWREQLDTVFIKKQEAEGAWAGEMERSKRFEEELAKLRAERDELNAKLRSEQQAAADSRSRAKDVETRLGRNAAEVERAQSQLGRQSAERLQAETELREELEAAKARRKQLEAEWSMALERNQAIETELAAMRQHRDDLNDKLSAEQRAAADLRRQAEELQARLSQHAADLEKRRADKERGESRWREQLEAVKAQKKELETAWAGAVERTMHCEEELANLRRERDELKGQQNAQNKVGTEVRRRTEDLEARWQAATAELTRAKAELQKQDAERERMESHYREQLETARALAKKLETAWTGAAERNKRFEAELAGLRQERAELKVKLGAGNGITMKPTRRVEDLEVKLGQTATELAQLKAALEKEKAARQRAESDLRKHAEAAKASATKRLTGTPSPASPTAAPPAPTPEAGRVPRLTGDLGQAPPTAVRYKLTP